MTAHETDLTAWPRTTGPAREHKAIRTRFRRGPKPVARNVRKITQIFGEQRHAENSVTLPAAQQHCAGVSSNRSATIANASVPAIGECVQEFGRHDNEEVVVVM